MVIGDRVLLRALTDGEATSSGLLISQGKGERTEAWAQKYQVVAVGEKVKIVKVGDWVYVNKWDVVHLHIDGVQYATSNVKEIVVKDM